MKNIKVHIIKFTAILISFLYVFAPLHKEIKHVLHSISHALEMPNNLIFHNHNKNLNYKLKESRNGYHEHKILDLMDILSEVNNNSKNPNSPNIIDINIDKHLTCLKYEFQKLTATKSPKAIDSYKETIIDLFYRKLNIPP